MMRTANTKQVFIELDAKMREFIQQGTGESLNIPKMSFEQPTESMIQMMINTEGPLMKALMEKDLFLLKAPSNHPFVISDNPVFRDNIFNRESNRGVTGLNCKGVEIYLPISPELCFAFYCSSIFDEIQEGLIKAQKLKNFGLPIDLESIEMMHNSMKKLETMQLNKANVEYYNSMQLWIAERRLFSSRADFSEYKNQIKETPKLKNPHRFATE